MATMNLTVRQTSWKCVFAVDVNPSVDVIDWSINNHTANGSSSGLLPEE